MIFIDTSECDSSLCKLSKPTKKYKKPTITYSHLFDHEFVENVFPDIIEYWIGSFPYNTYKCSSNQLVTLKCNFNHTWTKTINNHVKPGYFNCGDCFFIKYPRISKKYWYWGESACAFVLNKLNLKFKYQFKFNDRKFDFFVDGKLIEFDGPQHFNHKYLHAINSTFTITNDIIKTQYCIDQNFPLLRISYKEILDIEYWIYKFINSNDIIMFSNQPLYSNFPNI